MTSDKNRSLPDCDLREKIMLTAAVAVILFMGIYPQPFLRRMDSMAGQVIERVGTSSYARRPPASYQFRRAERAR